MENVKPQVVSVLIYTVMFAVLSKLIFWEKNYVYNVSFLLVYASIMVLLISTFDIMGDLVSDGIDVLKSYLLSGHFHIVRETDCDFSFTSTSCQ